MIGKNAFFYAALAVLMAGSLCFAGNDDAAKKEKQEKMRAEWRAKQETMKNKGMKDRAEADKRRPRREQWMDTLPGVKEEKERTRNVTREIHRTMIEQLREAMKDAAQKGEQVSQESVDTITQEAAEGIVAETLLHQKNMLKIAEKNKTDAVIKLKDDMQEKTDKMLEHFRKQQEKRNQQKHERKKEDAPEAVDNNEGAVF